LIARGLGAQLQLPNGTDPTFNPWDYCFGEGFHTFVASAGDADSAQLETDWNTHRIPYRKIGVINNSDRLEVKWSVGNTPYVWGVDVKALRTSWKKEGYWE
jgi:hypothetical protein